MLNTKDAFKLYSLLEGHIPDLEESSIFEFIGKIITSLNSSGELTNYADAILLMTKDLTLYELSKMPSEETIQLFMSGLVDNNIMKLHMFYKGLT